MEDGVAHMSGYFSEGRGLFDFGRMIPGSLYNDLFNAV
jgi:hypothetical protein